MCRDTVRCDRCIDDPTAEVTDLLQHLIRNACVNDGNAASGGEARSVDVLAQHLGGQRTRRRTPPSRRPVAATSSRASKASDPTAPTLLLLGHTDVVPANEERWRHDPYGGELDHHADGVDEVWGRGAVDMLNLTASMAVAMRRLAAVGFTPTRHARLRRRRRRGGARHLRRRPPRRRRSPTRCWPTTSSPRPAASRCRRRPARSCR